MIYLLIAFALIATGITIFLMYMCLWFKKHSWTFRDRLRVIDKTPRRVRIERIMAYGNDSRMDYKSYMLKQAAFEMADDLITGTLTTADRMAIVQPVFMTSYYSNGGELNDVNRPSPTLSTKDRCAVVQPQFIMRDFSTSGFNKSIEDPAGSILPSPKQNLVTTYILNPQWFSTTAASIEDPCATLIARQDKTPLYIVQTEAGELAIEVYEIDSPMTRKIKEFMAMYGIIDIYMRMLKEYELLQIQGFPKDYFDKVRARGIKITQTQVKKYIGNSVVPDVVKAWAEEIQLSLPPGTRKAA